MTIEAGLRAVVAAWIEDDPDPRDREELRALLDAGDEAELRDRFAGRLTFGTAGLRGAVAAGPNRMNRAVVRAATAAVAGWLHGAEAGTDAVRADGTADGGSAEMVSDGGGGAAGAVRAGGGSTTGISVVVGCDARHRSAEFADEVAGVLTGAGIAVHTLPTPCPTPLLAFAVRHLTAAAGIMITASHNPAADNGYKLYLSDGAQVIPPIDREIETRIGELGPLSEIPVADTDGPLVTRHGDEVTAVYLDAIITAVGGAPKAPLSVVYTPMHGVAR